MSAGTVVSVPGKTILMGEHAAVYGHPALVAAIDRRLTVSVLSSEVGGVRVEMPTIGWTGRAGWPELLTLAGERRSSWTEAFADGHGRFVPVREPHLLALIAAGEAASLAGGASLPGVAVTIASRIPSGAGCGSSAALGVAVVAALSAALGLPADDMAIARATLAVERAQHGRPSGVDVEAVLHGGIHWFHRGEDGLLRREGIRLGSSGLSAFRLFHSGAPAETTGAMVQLVRERERDDPLAVRDALATIDAATRQLRVALAEEDGDSVVALVRRCETALESLGVVPPQVASAIRAIERDGGGAKVSGAGGRTGAGAGLVLVVHPDPGWHARFAPPRGWTQLPAALGAPGLLREAA